MSERSVAVITGSTAGIGKATALALARAGWDIVLNSRHADEHAVTTRLRLEAEGAAVLHIAADVSQADQVDTLVRVAWEWRGSVALWVNNAGADVLSQGRYRLDAEEKLSQLLAIDVWGTVRCCRLVGERMLQQGYGHIINLGWDQAEVGGVSTVSGQIFSLVKGGIMAYTRALAQALAPTVRVNCVAPGWIQTQWGEEVSAARYEQIRRGIPLHRWGRPEDVAHAITWLASDQASYITGQTIRVNGGVVP
ncbi:MAG: SDR family oxidoreductase [Caldilineae bacterium]|nr:MAG: SDR family oxidoreductase [Caldilineae bacterium]